MPAFGVGLEGGVEVYSTSCSQHMKEKDYDNNHDDDDDDEKKDEKGTLVHGMDGNCCRL